MKTFTYQRIGRVAARLSRIECKKGHALAGDARISKYFPDQPLDTGVDAL